MYIVELALKNSPMPLTVQKEDKETAEATYQKALDAMKNGNPVMLELTCDQMLDKKVAVFVSDLAAVQVYEKSGSAGTGGRSPGFFSLANE
ncbi:MAG: hypothetical protein DCF25_11365 [Leptolyngbya foveolarum]|uniref:UPF0367 protein DCF25_11365 n=1 Tax=Leptolyngbya foveolarum TaxID=47253 RepID=A0A2W4U8E5_9CYAN|nr:MAG: hypothetical protein DCF25_11365 [Leptolyngbya foveolarum]